MTTTRTVVAAIHLCLKQLRNMESQSATTRNQIGSVLDRAGAISLDKIFGHRGACDHNEMNLYMAFYQRIPNYISESGINCKRAIKWFEQVYKNEIRDFYFNKYAWGKHVKPEIDNMFFFIYEDLLVNFDTQSSYVRFLFKTTEIGKVDQVIAKIRKFKNSVTKPEIVLLLKIDDGIVGRSITVNKPKLNIVDNYNNDFIEVHQTNLRRLSAKNDKGLILLHGKSGTGKTTYIRYLISVVKKKVIFLPPDLAASITGPHLLSILTNNPGSILVVEDAENIISDRENDGASPVSALLNISDGLLSDSLNIQIICSFNTDISKVDNALLRKGRLISRYEFKELEVPKAQALSDKLGFKSEIKSPLTLTAIYNQEETGFEQIKTRMNIGFRANSLN